MKKQIAECDSTGRELSFEWSHQTILSTDSKVSLILPNSTKHSGSERVKGLTLYDGHVTFIGKVWCSRITCIFITFFFLINISIVIPPIGRNFLFKPQFCKWKLTGLSLRFQIARYNKYMQNKENQNCQVFLLVLFFLLFSHESNQGKIMTPVS